jgi:hypothetical protein
MSESTSPYVAQLLSELVFVIRDIRHNASLYKKSELEGFKTRAQELIAAVEVNLENDNFYDA